jgi:alcohol dehydrogenase
MLALVFDRTLRVETNRPLPRREGEALVRVRSSGVCATDLEILKGYMGFRGVLGHEWVGVVAEADDRTWIGRRVVGEINVACGQCSLCRRNLPTHCTERTVLGISGRDGAFAEYLSLPLRNLHRVPDALSDGQAVFTEPLAAACAILEQVSVRPTDRVAVLGAGRLGQLCARVLALTGAEVTAVARHPAKLERLPVGIRRLTADRTDARDPLDVVVECTGSACGLELASRLVRPRGTVVLKTTVGSTHTIDLAPWVIREITVVGSRCGPFASALRLMEQGLVDPSALIDEQFPLAEGPAAIARAGTPGVLKVLLAH